MNRMENGTILNRQTMTSLEIAELTGMRHADVMRAIRNMEPAWQKVSQRNFALSSYKQHQPNGGEKDVPCYALDKTECLYVATKFNDEARAKLVLRWEELEKQQQVPRTFADALMLAATQAKHIEEQQETRNNTEWTQKGRLFLYDTLKGCGILPLIERG